MSLPIPILCGFAFSWLHWASLSPYSNDIYNQDRVAAKQIWFLKIKKTSNKLLKLQFIARKEYQTAPALEGLKLALLKLETYQHIINI
jgi:hypothetical protein